MPNPTISAVPGLAVGNTGRNTKESSQTLGIFFLFLFVFYLFANQAYFATIFFVFVLVYKITCLQRTKNHL
jgi:hypothetical protein